MTHQIKDSGWLDFVFKRGDYNAKSFEGDYVGWLNSLTNEQFLHRYNDVRERENALD